MLVTLSFHFGACVGSSHAAITVFAFPFSVKINCWFVTYLHTVLDYS